MTFGAFDPIQHLPALQVVTPLIGATVCALIRQRHICMALMIAVTIATALISFALLMHVQWSGTISYALGGFEPPLGVEYRIDTANAFMLVLIALVGALVAIYAPRSLADEIPPERQGWFTSVYLICLAGLLGMAITGDAFNAFVFMEISSLAMYTLIALGRDRRALVAAFQYLVIGTMGATFYVIGVGFLFLMTGTLNFYDMANLLGDVESQRPLIAGLGFITIGLGLKFAMFPLHLWLPNAYAYAPTMATAFIASTATKVALYLLFRFWFSIYGGSFVLTMSPAAAVITAVAVLAMILCSLSAIWQINVKRMLAYSSVAQVGYILLGVGLMTEIGVAGGLSHIFNHALIKCCLFLAIGCVFYATGVTKTENLAGIGRVMPFTMGAFVIAGLGLIGVPGTAGFVSKWMLIQGAVEQEQWWLVGAIVISSVLAVFYIGRVIEVAWFRAPIVVIHRRVPGEMLAITLAMAAAIIFFGISTDLNSQVATVAAQELLAGWGAANGS